jgi:predicted dehydrogenase
MSRLRVGVVGVGHLGKEHARILAGMSGVDLVGVADHNAAQAQAVAQRCRTRPFETHEALLPLIDAAVIAVPTTQHYTVARDFLDRGVPVLVEKPFTIAVGEADELIGLAERRGVLVQVGHVERFNPAFEELARRQMRPRYVRAERCGGFSGRSTDVGAVLDLMVHDLDLILALAQAPVTSVEAFGAALLGGHEDMAQARLRFADGCVADLSASRTHPTPLRRLQVWSAAGYAGADLAARRLTLMQPAAHLRDGRIDSRRLDAATLATLKAELFGRHVQALELDCAAGERADQLTRELEELVRCVKTGARPRVDGRAGRDAVALAAAVLDALRAHRWQDDAAPVGPLFTPAPEQRAA